MNKKALIFGIIAGVLFIALVFVAWKWMALRKNVGIVATNTATPTSSSVSAAIDAITAQAAVVK